MENRTTQRTFRQAESVAWFGCSIARTPWSMIHPRQTGGALASQLNYFAITRPTRKCSVALTIESNRIDSAFRVFGRRGPTPDRKSAERVTRTERY